MTKNWKAILGVSLIFIFGWIAGILSTTVFIGHRTADVLKRGPEAAADILERRMTRNLALDSNQSAQVHQLFLDNVLQHKRIQAQIQPQVQMVNRQTFQQIKLVLNPEQQVRFQENIDFFRKRFGKNAFNTNAGNTPK